MQYQHTGGMFSFQSQTSCQTVYIIITQQAAVGLFPTVRASGVTRRVFFGKFLLFRDGILQLTGTLQEDSSFLLSCAYDHAYVDLLSVQ